VPADAHTNCAHPLLPTRLHAAKLSVRKTPDQDDKRVTGVENYRQPRTPNSNRPPPDTPVQHIATTSCAAAPKPVTELPLPANPRSRPKKTGMHICPHPDCGKPFRSPSDLRKHLRSHSREKPFVCLHEGCGHAFAQQSHLTTHWRTHTGEKPFACSYEGCGRSFAHRGARKIHLRIHSGEKPFACLYENCGRLFTESGALKKHLRTHTREKPFVCPDEGCQRSFAQPGDLKSHRRIHSREKPFVCSWEGCRHSFTHSGNLKTHWRFHTREKPFVCPYEGCGRSFAHACVRKTHMRLHTGEKPFACLYEDCRHVFAQLGALTAHLRVHTGEKPFVCLYEGCRHAYAQPGALTRHKRIHSRKKTFACSREGCGRAFSQASDLKRHLRFHTGTKDFVCPHDSCGRSFVQASDLNRHAFVHSEEKPFACPREDCTKRFKRPAALQAHQNTHARQKRRSCVPDGGVQHVSTISTISSLALRTGSQQAETAVFCARKGCGTPLKHSDTRTHPLPVHSATRPYVCHYPECNRRFLQLLALKMHQRRHTGEQAGISSGQSYKPGVIRESPLPPAVSPPADDRHCRLSAPSGHPARRPSTLTIGPYRHRATRPCLRPGGSHRKRVTQHPVLKPQGLVRTRTAQGAPVPPGHSSSPGYQPWRKPGGQQPGGTALLPAADINIRHQLTKDVLWDAVVGSHDSQNTTPAREESTGTPAGHYRSVIAWVSGGIVYKTPLGQYSPGRPNLSQEAADHL